MGRVDFSSFEQFSKDLSIYGDSILWKESRWLERIICRLIVSQESRLIEIMRQFRKAIDQQELKKVGDPRELKLIGQKIEAELITPYRNTPSPFYKKVIWILQSLGRQWIIYIPTRETVDKAYSDMKMTLASMQYREKLHAKVEESEEISDVTEVTRKWKYKVEIYTDQQKTQLTPFDKRALKHLYRYKHLAQELLPSNQTQDAFKFMVRNALPVSVYAHAPATTRKLHEWNLLTRVAGLHTSQGKGKPKMKRVTIMEDGRVGIRFAHENRFVNIITEKTVKVADNLEVPLEQIFADFAGKNLRPGNYEMFWDGIHKWDPHHYSVPMDKLDWYWQLPVMDKLTFEELGKIFPEQNLQQGDRIWGFGGTRQTTGMSADGSHGYITFYEPDPSDGLYRVWSFGTFAEVWPETACGRAKFVGNTVQAVWAYPEPNYAAYPHRQQALMPVVIRVNELEKLYEFQERLKTAVNNKEHVFMWGDDNCACPAEKVITNEEPKLIQTPLDDLEVPFFMKPIIVPYQITPKPLKNLVRKFIILCIGGARELHGKSLLKSKFANTGLMNYPGTLHRRILAKEITGVVHGGHNRDHEPIEA